MERAPPLAAVLTLPTAPLFLFYQNPPNFLRASALSEHISPVVVIPVEASSPDSEPIMELVDMETSSQQVRRRAGKLQLWHELGNLVLEQEEGQHNLWRVLGEHQHLSSMGHIPKNSCFQVQ